MTDISTTSEVPGGRGGGTALAGAWIFLSLAGVSAALTVMFLCMRAVMDLGGFCASGGPYQIATQCPKGVAGLMISSIWGGLLLAFVYAWQSWKAKAPQLVALAWPALFLSLGYNFLTYALKQRNDEGVVWSWLICGILFVIMGGGPLVAWLVWGRHDLRTPNLPRAAAPIVSPDARALFFGSGSGASGGGGLGGGVGGDMVSRLERLAELRRGGDITEEEYAAVKARILARGDPST